MRGPESGAGSKLQARWRTPCGVRGAVVSWVRWGIGILLLSWKARTVSDLFANMSLWFLWFAVPEPRGADKVRIELRWQEIMTSPGAGRSQLPYLLATFCQSGEGERTAEEALLPPFLVWSIAVAAGA